MRHVRDVHLQAPAAVRPPLHIHRVVKVPRRFSVNRHDRQMPKVVAPFILAFAHRLGTLFRFQQNCAGKFVWQMMFANNDLDIHAEIAGRPKNFNYASRWRRPAARIAQ